MTVSEAIKELKETWSFTTEEINHIRKLMNSVKSTYETQKPKRLCPECGKESKDHPTKHCDMVYGRRGWRQLGSYDS